MITSAKPDISFDCFPFGTASQKNRFETRWHLPRELGQGSLTRIELRPGFHLHCSEYKVNERLVREVRNPNPAFGVGFCVSGRIMGRPAGMSSDVVTGSGQSQLIYMPDQSGTMVDERDTYRLGVTILVEPEVFHALTRDEMDPLPNEFRQVADGSAPKIYQHHAVVTPEMYQAVKQVLDCPYEGLTRRLFLESKAIELLALRLDSLMESNIQNDQKAELIPADMEKIHHAAELLDRDLKEPPTLFALAKTVGLSHVKLNRGFRALFGTTAFGYLRQIRLHTAKKLLETRQMNVTEAAFAVGYNSVSAFSRAFAGQYGLQPNACNRPSQKADSSARSLAVAGR